MIYRFVVIFLVVGLWRKWGEAGWGFCSRAWRYIRACLDSRGCSFLGRFTARMIEMFRRKRRAMRGEWMYLGLGEIQKSST